MAKFSQFPSRSVRFYWLIKDGLDFSNTPSPFSLTSSILHIPNQSIAALKCISQFIMEKLKPKTKPFSAEIGTEEAALHINLDCCSNQPSSFSIKCQVLQMGLSAQKAECTALQLFPDGNQLDSPHAVNCRKS